jgi:hypothetical protein
MSVEEGTAEVGWKNGELRINFVVNDPEIVEFIREEYGDDVTQNDIQRILRSGVEALRVAGTAEQVDYVDRRFGDIEDEFEREIDTLRETIDKAIRDDGSDLDRRLDDHLDNLQKELRNRIGDDGEFIRDALHPDDEDSPIYTVKQQIRDLRDEIKNQQGQAEERKYSTRKGDDFEDAVERALQDSSIGPTDNVDRKTTETGVKTRSKKGDFVVTTGGGDRIVVEAKDRTGHMPKDDIAEYLEESLENREADYALMVMRNIDAVPKTKMGWFHEFDQERACVVLSEGVDHDPEWRLLRFAYNWARTRTAQAHAEADDEADGDVIAEELDLIEERIDDFGQIRSSAETIRDEARSIESNLADIESEVIRRIQSVRSEFTVTNAT